MAQGVEKPAINADDGYTFELLSGMYTTIQGLKEGKPVFI